ncbi:GTPase [Liquorilactobacillus vini]|uniref:GTPase n=1 Tax=Liquorilactobacillus vini TaxID=238015 RepID=UPI0002FB9077|nr:GTPase domain-containing protein [Liquorilactobacillus vini]
MKKDSKLNIDELWVEFQQHLSSLEKVNILIAGKSGVGKSTLINAAFRDNLAETGIGKPTTSRINLIEKEGVPVRIYDTVGFELDFRHLKKAQKDIHNLIKKTSKTPQLDDDIHCLWYCVSAPSARLEDEERSFIASIAKQGIPVILVLTKAGDKIEAEKLLNNIWIDISANLAAAVVLLAQRYGGTQPYGVDQLIEKNLSSYSRKIA